MKNQETGKYWCDFCGNHQDLTCQMIIGKDNAAICDECVCRCQGIILERIKSQSIVKGIDEGAAS